MLAYVSTADLDGIEARLLDPDRLVGRRCGTCSSSPCRPSVVALAVPLGVLATRPSLRRWARSSSVWATWRRGCPRSAWWCCSPYLGRHRLRPAIFALVLYAFLPILRNTIVGLQQVDPFVVESARGMGMPRLTVLRRIELPLAVPVVLAGVRTAAVINVGTATIAALINAGGLGETIYQGLVLNRVVATVVGALLAGVLALLIDHLGGLLEQALRPKGL